MPVTIKDVARAAGVSPSTVSRALTTPELVQAETRDRVERSAAELGYHPNRAARGLITGRTGNIGLIVPDLTNPFFPGVVKGVQSRARESDFSVFLADTDEDPAAEAGLVRALCKQVDGIVLCSPRMTEEDLRSVIGETPVVMLNRRVGQIPAITIDNADGIRQAVAHLAALGHRRIAYVAGPRSSWSNRERVRALRSVDRREPASTWSRSATSHPSSPAVSPPPTWCSPPASPRSSPTTTSSRWACSTGSPPAASTSPRRSA